MNEKFEDLIKRYEEMKAIGKEQGYFTEAQWDEYLSIESMLMKIGIVKPSFYSED